MSDEQPGGLRFWGAFGLTAVSFFTTVGLFMIDSLGSGLVILGLSLGLGVLMGLWAQTRSPD